MTESHTILLPKANYYEWVKATQAYALAFGVPITPNPIKAGSYEYVTVIAAPDGYPFEGEIVGWLKERFPDAKLDPVEVNSPEDLVAEFEKRVERYQRFGLKARAAMGDLPDDAWIGRRQAMDEASDEKLVLEWPTDYPRITQEFGANPEIYSKWGLPGHEGVDIRAPMDTNVYACADGEVYRVEQDPDVHPYGKHVRIRHANGYRTIYGHLASVLVSEGQQVSAKELIGHADSTGNSTGSHLHLTLKKDGATTHKETHFKGDVIDPTPFLVFPKAEEEMGGRGPETYPWAKPCLVGVNLGEDGSMADADFEVAETARLEAIKIKHNTPASALNRLKESHPNLFIIARLSYPLGQNQVSPQEWVTRISPHVDALYQMGVQYYEIHQSPNLQTFGWNYSWYSGGGFGRWWLDVVGQLRDRYEGAKYGFPGVSPGGQVEGQRLDAKTFLEQADDAIATADWVGVNCYWTTDEGLEDEDQGGFYKYVRAQYPQKLLFITEFANVDALTNPYVKGNQYADYYQQLRHVPGMGAAFAQVLFSGEAQDKISWRGQDGELNRIPVQVGKRGF